mmetsp:Transcript_37011/g.96940  ORF Transcript_37011/g.96940 Transcript_37011/m.96940 type:complete len:543 (+) Transcript_37011:71-1699(+)
MSVPEEVPFSPPVGKSHNYAVDDFERPWLQHLVASGQLLPATPDGHREWTFDPIEAPRAISGLQKESNLLSVKISLRGACDEVSICVASSCHHLTDMDLTQLGRAFGSCQCLKFLDVDFTNNKITGPNLRDFAEGVGQCTQLTSLHLNVSDNKIRGKHLGEFADGIDGCAQLTSLYLDVSGNEISKGLGLFGAGLRKCHSLERLRLDCARNEIQDIELESFGQGISLCSKLAVLILDFSRNAIGSGESRWQLRNFTCFLGKCKGLRIVVLDFLGNKITGKDLRQLGRGMKDKSNPVNLCKRLEVLNLNFERSAPYSGTGFAGEEDVCEMFKSFGNTISKCENLFSLSLNFADHGMTDEHVRMLGKQITRCRTLESLHLNFKSNKIGGKFFDQFQNSQLSSLTLNLRNNGFNNDVGAEPLLELLRRQVSLRECKVELAGASFTEEQKSAVAAACAEARRSCRPLEMELFREYLKQHSKVPNLGLLRNFVAGDVGPTPDEESSEDSFLVMNGSASSSFTGQTNSDGSRTEAGSGRASHSDRESR